MLYIVPILLIGLTFMVAFAIRALPSSPVVDFKEPPPSVPISLPAAHAVIGELLQRRTLWLSTLVAALSAAYATLNVLWVLVLVGLAAEALFATISALAFSKRLAAPCSRQDNLLMGSEGSIWCSARTWKRACGLPTASATLQRWTGAPTGSATLRKRD